MNIPHLLPAPLSFAGLALLSTVYATPAENTARNIRTDAQVIAKALEALARQEESGCSDECRVSRIRYCKAGTIRPHVYKDKDNDEGVKLPACIGIYLATVDKCVLGGEAEYFFDARTGELLGYDIWE